MLDRERERWDDQGNETFFVVESETVATSQGSEVAAKMAIRQHGRTLAGLNG